MAVNDVVSGISASNTILTYQPAAGVECVITSVTRGATAGAFGVTNGSVSSQEAPTANTNTYDLKIFINNTNYLTIAAVSGASTSYTGKQIK